MTQPPPSFAEDSAVAQWEREAIRLHRRYEREVVDAFGLCPWAKRARTVKAARDRVVLQDTPDSLAPSLAVLSEMTADPRVEVAFVIYPRLALGRRAFEQFVARVRTADGDRHELGRAPFVFAAFHPDAEADAGDPERLIPFLRRTPDPTLQLLRSHVLERIRAGAPHGTQFVDTAALTLLQSVEPAPMPLREQIARANLATVTRVGLDELKKLLDELRRDRDASYRKLPSVIGI